MNITFSYSPIIYISHSLTQVSQACTAPNTAALTVSLQSEQADIARNLYLRGFSRRIPILLLRRTIQLLG